jgi:hypothetical protein
MCGCILGPLTYPLFTSKRLADMKVWRHGRYRMKVKFILVLSKIQIHNNKKGACSLFMTDG